MKKLLFIILAVFLVSMTFFAGCTGSDSGSATPESTPDTAKTVTPTPFSEPTQSVQMVPGSVEQPEAKYKVDVQVNKDGIYGTITAIFRGGLGQNFVNNIVVDVYYPDGNHESKELSATNVGNQVEFEGNPKSQERVKVTVTFDGNIGTYVIYDSLVPEKL
ncbi:hypothetical protein F1737_05200 [Methanoplanus sp. FWC-SCC4]|uniref:Lipoprotein n=1 Tax=Methanochimaera problematica TaxID=2609417 RepID=A0AA97FDB8_9EURY|nr:hypothetical protein [Methanoplanus sp. FWC-SCC4]WOF16144.1 hypothetical protein F1737_05200 [Methanoplanus sp. FWC-SCC4]